MTVLFSWIPRKAQRGIKKCYFVCFVLKVIPKTSFAVLGSYLLSLALRKCRSLQKLLWPRGPGCSPVAPAVAPSGVVIAFKTPVAPWPRLWPRGPGCGPSGMVIASKTPVAPWPRLWPRGLGCGPSGVAPLPRLLWPRLWPQLPEWPRAQSINPY